MSEPPRVFDDFEIMRPLGAGGMGTVYVARDRGLDRLVAIKFVASTGGGDPHARERFAGEARALARLQHPNIVSLFRTGEVAGRPYLVCELVAGTRLDELPRPVAWPSALAFGVGLARGLAAAHERGVLHRDIKPANVIVAADGLVKLIDFGLAVLADGSAEADRGAESTPAWRSDRVTAAGSVVGTPRYMAPELWTGAPATERSDLYAFGLVLHELLVGGIPGERVPDLAHVPPPFARVIDDCVRRDPAERAASAADVRDQLAHLASATRPARPACPTFPAAVARALAPYPLGDDLATHDGLGRGSARRISRTSSGSRSMSEPCWT